MISYADAEQLAFGALLLEGHPIRLSGQDCRRGTFSHRHAVVRDFETAEPYIPLNNIREVGEEGTLTPPGSIGDSGKPRQAKLCVYDSPLSEASVLGFEYGYSLADPGMLVIWEAQFGDFANGAQVITDQFIASAESKWDRWSGVVMLLPHGYEGAGPEHSSARLERFLELCGQNNMQVVYPTTAAQVFHMYRRQMERDFRKPLVVMTPKSMLRIPTSPLNDICTGAFREMLDDPEFVDGSNDRAGVQRVILCCGKVYHELNERRNLIGREDIAILRIEQVYPFHSKMMKQLIEQYPSDAELVYVQEEPSNVAAYRFVQDALSEDLGIEKLGYIGRPRTATPATGSKSQHKIEQEELLTRAVGAKPEKNETKKTVASAKV